MFTIGLCQKTTGGKKYRRAATGNLQQEATFEAEYNIAEQIIFEFLQAEQLLNIQQVNLDSTDTVKHSLTHFHWFLTPLTMTLKIEQGMRLTQTLQQALQTLSWVDDSAQNSLAKPKAMQLLASG